MAIEMEAQAAQPRLPLSADGALVDAPLTVYEGDTAGRWVLLPTDSPIVPREYQGEAGICVLTDYRGGQRDTLVVLPTSMGKTVLAVLIHDQLRESGHAGKILWIAHTKELLEQAQGSFHRADASLKVGWEKAALTAQPDCDVIVASNQTLKGERLEEFFKAHPDISMLVVDEAHHAAANTYLEIIKAFRAACPEGLNLALTATPDRADTKSIRRFYHLSFHMSLEEAIELGWQPEIEMWQIDTETDLDDVPVRAGEYAKGALGKTVNTLNRNAAVVKAYQRISPNGHAIGFCADIEHAKDQAKAFRDEGIAAEAIDGGMKDEEREAIVARFRAGITRVLLNVNCTVEGFDVATVDTVLLEAPTRSASRLEQMIGRATRLHPDIAGTIGGCNTTDERLTTIAASKKASVKIIDFVDASAKYGRAKSKRANEIFGLPGDLNCEGETIRRVKRNLEEVAELDPSVRAARNLNEIKLIARRARVLGAKRVQPLEALTDLAFREAIDGSFRLNMVTKRKDNQPHWISVRKDPFDLWEIAYCVRGRSPKVLGSTDSLDAAIESVEQRLSGSSRVRYDWLIEGAAWRSRPVTERQQYLLEPFKAELRRDPQTAGEAFDMLSYFKTMPDYEKRIADYYTEKFKPTSGQIWVLTKKLGVKRKDVPKTRDEASAKIKELTRGRAAPAVNQR